jgi:hypothetical protein
MFQKQETSAQYYNINTIDNGKDISAKEYLQMNENSSNPFILK